MESNPDVPNGELNAAHERIKAAASKVNDAVEAFTANSDNVTSQRLFVAAKKLLLTVRPPTMLWADDALEMVRMSSIHLFQTWGGFELIPAEGTISIPDLAEKLNAEVSLIERITTLLTSLSLLTFHPPNSLAHTPRSLTLRAPSPFAPLYHLMWENCMIPSYHLPSYFSTYGRKEPQAANHIPATFARGVPAMSFYEYLATDPGFLKRFTHGMGIMEEQEPAAGVGGYDLEWVIKKGGQEEGERVLIVDVGGGRGQALGRMKRRWEGLDMGRCVLAERSEILGEVERAGVEELKGLGLVEADFHKEMPVKGAMVYFIRRCLHNYSDTIAANILKNVAEAMADDSKVLIQEDIRTVPPEPRVAFLDFLMIAFGGKVRTLQNWEDVLDKAGLKISLVTPGVEAERSLSVIECVKKA